MEKLFTNVLRIKKAFATLQVRMTKDEYLEVHTIYILKNMSYAKSTIVLFYRTL